MRHRLLSFTVLFACLAFIAMPAAAENDEAVASAGSAASPWLAMADAGKYQETWDTASSLFRDAVTPEEWTKAVTAARQPFGALTSRELGSAKFYRELPGAPDGEYVVLIFDSAFENKAKAVETVTVMKDGDAWRVSGYFIR